MLGGVNPNKDMEVVEPPPDSVSCMAWSPAANYLAAGSWNNEVRIWQVAPNGQSKPCTVAKHDGPVLCVGWAKRTGQVFSGAVDSKVLCQDLQSNKTFQVAAHEGPVKCVQWVEEFPGILSAGWDKKLRAWDCRQAQPVFQVDLPERAYAMDVKWPLAVVATAERKICIFNLQSNPRQPWKTIDSPLKFQSRCIAAFPGANGFAVGSVEGRVAIHYLKESGKQLNFAFKCHREKKDNSRSDAAIYAVNSINFHPTHGTFSTTGSDGTFHFWDKDSKQRLKGFKKMPMPIPCGSFNGDGKIFAYAVSYDWHKGATAYNPKAGSKIFLHAVQETEIKPRGGKFK